MFFDLFICGLDFDFRRHTLVQFRQNFSICLVLVESRLFWTIFMWKLIVSRISISNLLLIFRIEAPFQLISNILSGIFPGDLISIYLSFILCVIQSTSYFSLIRWKISIHPDIIIIRVIWLLYSSFFSLLALSSVTLRFSFFFIHIFNF